MESLGNYLFLIIMGIVLLLNFVFEKMRKVPPPGQPRPDADEGNVVTPVEIPARRMGSRSPYPAERRPGPRRYESAPEVRVPARRMLTGRENLRQAIILMTVLGPPVSQQDRNNQGGSLSGPG